MKQKGQAAIEFLMITSFVFVMLIPLLYFVFNYTQESVADIADAKLAKIGVDIINTAESIYYYNEPSQIILELDMPAGVRNMTIVTNDPNNIEKICTRCTELQFVLQKSNAKIVIPFSSEIELRTTNFNGISYPYLSKFEDRAYTQGIKKFKIQAKKDFVLIGLPDSLVSTNNIDNK
jgi:hypothetical protein